MEKYSVFEDNYLKVDNYSDDEDIKKEELFEPTPFNKLPTIDYNNEIGKKISVIGCNLNLTEQLEIHSYYKEKQIKKAGTRSVLSNILDLMYKNDIVFTKITFKLFFNNLCKKGYKNYSCFKFKNYVMSWIMVFKSFFLGDKRELLENLIGDSSDYLKCFRTYCLQIGNDKWGKGLINIYNIFKGPLNKIIMGNILINIHDSRLKIVKPNSAIYLQIDHGIIILIIFCYYYLISIYSKTPLKMFIFKSKELNEILIGKSKSIKKFFTDHSSEEAFFEIENNPCYIYIFHLILSKITPLYPNLVLSIINNIS
jgi:hypothetical protein